MVTTYRFAASDSAAEDRSAADYVFDGTAWNSEALGIFASNDATDIIFAPGTYAFEGTITLGDHTRFRGSKPIPIPAEQSATLDHDPSSMAVFSSRIKKLWYENVGSGNQARIYTKSRGTDIQIEDLYMVGYTGIKTVGANNVRITRVVISNYHDRASMFPNGNFASMGHSGMTGAFWICPNEGKGALPSGTYAITLTSCIAQFSSHHGYCIHYPYASVAKDITFYDCRAIGCGSGSIKTDANGAACAQPGELAYRYYCGYCDWSVGFDLNESCHCWNVTAEKCYAGNCWKAGFYQEPYRTDNLIQNHNTNLIDCFAEENGWRATIPVADPDGNPTPRMITYESEHANYYLNEAHLLRCGSRHGMKSGYDITPEWSYGDSPRATLVDCWDCRSRYGIVTRPNGTTNVTITNFKAVNNLRRALNIHGSGAGPFRITGLTIVTQNPNKSPVMVGRMFRCPKAFSLSQSHRDSFTAGFTSENNSSNLDIAITGTVYGYQGTAPVQVHTGSSIKDWGKVNLTLVSTAPDTAFCTGGPVVVPPGDDDDGDGGGGGDPGTRPVAEFAGTPNTGTAPLTVQFVDQTPNSTAWVWSFGDGEHSTLRHPAHTYTVPGTYPVSLTAYVGAYMDVETKVGYVKVYADTSDTQPAPNQKYWNLSSPRVTQAYDGDGAIQATVIVRIDEG